MRSAVIGEDVELLDIVRGAPGHHRMHAAGIVAEHAAERVVVVRRRVGAEGQMMLLGGVAQLVEHAAGLDRREARARDRFEMMLFRYFEKSISTATLQPCAGEARCRRRASRAARRMLAAQRNGRDDVFDSPRNDDADRHLAVVRGVGRIERPAAVVEAHFALDRPA